MIFHSIRMAAKDGVTSAQIDEVLDCLRTVGREMPRITSFVVGREFGGGFGWGATFALEDLDVYWEYLVHPAHARADRIGLPLAARFETYDVSDDDDPEIGARIAALHHRRYTEDPELAGLVATLPGFGGN